MSLFTEYEFSFNSYVDTFKEGVNTYTGEWRVKTSEDSSQMKVSFTYRTSASSEEYVVEGFTLKYGEVF